MGEHEGAPGTGPGFEMEIGTIKASSARPRPVQERSADYEAKHSMEEDEEMCLDKTIILFTMYTT